MRSKRRAATRRTSCRVSIALTMLFAPAAAHGQESGADLDASLLERARAVLERHPVFDGHNDLPWEIRVSETAPRDVEAYDLRVRTPGQTDLARLRAGGVGAQFWSVYVPGEYADSGFARVQLEQIDLARRMIDAYPELELARSWEDVERSIRDGRIASLLGAEGGHAIENSLGALMARTTLS